MAPSSALTKSGAACSSPPSAPRPAPRAPMNQEELRPRCSPRAARCPHPSFSASVPAAATRPARSAPRATRGALLERASAAPPPSAPALSPGLERAQRGPGRRRASRSPPGRSRPAPRQPRLPRTPPRRSHRARGGCGGCSLRGAGALGGRACSAAARNQPPARTATPAASSARPVRA